MDLAETFTVRTAKGAVFSVHGWLVDVVVLETTERVMYAKAETACNALPEREGENPCAWNVCSLLHAQAAG